jgi:hypothetical protein
MGTNEITQRDSDNLADIIWWIKGYIVGAKENCESCPFCNDHIESLKKTRIHLQKLIDDKPKEDT